MTLDPTPVRKRNAIAYWEERPDNRPVKITSIVRHPSLWVDGYITCWKFIAGRTLNETERILGLKAGSLASGAYLYEFMRLPRAGEFELRGYTQCPGGEPWTPASDYPVGAGAPQWQVAHDACIPARLAATIDPGGVVVMKSRAV